MTVSIDEFYLYQGLGKSRVCLDHREYKYNKKIFSYLIMQHDGLKIEPTYGATKFSNMMKIIGVDMV